MEKALEAKSSEYPSHPDKPTIALIGLGLFTFVLTAIFNGLAGSGAGVPSVFYPTVGDISDKYELFITPAGFTFSIWSIIYLWLAASLVFFIASIFITNPAGRVYLSPPVATPAVMATFSANMVMSCDFDVSGKNADRQLSETFGDRCVWCSGVEPCVDICLGQIFS